MEVEFEEIKAQQEKVQFSSLLSTERSIDLLSESVEVAGQTSKTLVEHREKLERTSGNLKKINESLKISQKNINKMKGFFTRLRTFFPVKKGNGEVSTCKEPEVHEVIEEENESNPQDQCEAVQDHESDTDSDDYPTLRNSMDEKIDANLDVISNQITNLKSMAQHMGEEIAVQNDLLDNIRDQAELVDATIVQQDLQIKKLLS